MQVLKGKEYSQVTLRESKSISEITNALNSILYVPDPRLKPRIIKELIIYLESKFAEDCYPIAVFISYGRNSEVSGFVVCQNDPLYRSYSRKIGTFGDIIKITPKEEFWVHCSSFQAWAEHKYNTQLLDSRLAFPILRKLTEVGDIQALKVFKNEIVSKLKEAPWQVEHFLIKENYISFLSQDELLYGILNIDEAIVMRNIITTSPIIEFCLVLHFDDLREKFLNLDRSFRDLYNTSYYFSVNYGRVAEIELLIDKDYSSPIKGLDNLSMLKTLYLYCNDASPRFSVNLSSLVHLNIYCFGKVKIPNIFQNFPNIRVLNIYPDPYQSVKPNLDPDIFKHLNNVEHIILFKV